MDIDRYETQSDDDNHIFTFISEGDLDIIKIVRYDRENIVYKNLDGNTFNAYNLGFGDKKSNLNCIDDLARSNNGDMYLIFNTILHTIPLFFSKKKNAAIHIRGAERTRHLIYLRFLNQRYDKLILEYMFYGSLAGVIHPFEKGTFYDYIVVMPKKT